MKKCLGNWRLTSVLGLFALLVLEGCGAADKGPKRIALTGSVTRENIPIDDGNILFTPASGAAAATRIINGKYKFDKQDGVPTGTYKVKITQNPLRDKTWKGKPNEAPVLPDDRFKKKLPPAGWLKDAEVTADSKPVIDFAVD